MNNKARKLSEKLSKKTTQLDALLKVASSPDFEDWSTRIKSDYLWACSDLSEKIRSDFDLFHNEIQRK